MEGQISILDYSYDRRGRLYYQKWMSRERCENCEHWQRNPVEDQPPAGWGVYGLCQYIHDANQKGYENTNKVSYCTGFSCKYGEIEENKDAE